jgi:hypothetical protein
MLRLFSGCWERTPNVNLLPVYLEQPKSASIKLSLRNAQVFALEPRRGELQRRGICGLGCIGSHSRPSNIECSASVPLGMKGCGNGI